MLTLAWIIVGLIPGFLALELARQPRRVVVRKTTRSLYPRD